MKLYYSPGACSLSPHITLLEAGLPATLVKVDTKTHKLAGGEDFYAINGKGYVPVLELDDGRRLTEGPAIVQYLADRKPESRLAPAAGQLRALSPAGMAEFHHLRAAQAVRPVLRAQHAGRVQADPARQAPAAARLAGRSARRQRLSDGQSVHRCRCLPVHDPALVAVRRHRPRQMAGRRRVQGAGRSAPARARSFARRRSDQGAGEGGRLMERSAARRPRASRRQSRHERPASDAVPVARLADARGRARRRGSRVGCARRASCRVRARC